MVDVADPVFKAQGPCGCGDESCTAWGTYKRDNNDGTRCVSRQCKCRRCRGRQNRKRGIDKQRKATKQLGLSHGQFAGTHEEALQGPVVTEHKADARHAKPIATAYRRMRAQSDAARSIGDVRPFVASSTAPGSSQTLYTVAADDLEAFVYALAEAWGYGGVS